MCVQCRAVCALLQVVLKDIRVTGARTIEADDVSAGYLQQRYFPWNARVDPYEGERLGGQAGGVGAGQGGKCA